MPESFYEDFASILAACKIEEEVAMDNDVRMKVATDIMSGGDGTLHTHILKTPAAGLSADVRPRVTNGGGGKAGDQSDERKRGPGRAYTKEPTESSGVATRREREPIDRARPRREPSRLKLLDRVRLRRRDDRIGAQSVKTDPDEG